MLLTHRFCIPIPSSYRSLLVLYSTTTPKTEIDSWYPNNSDPSPYEIFGLNHNSKINTIALRKKYHRFVKLYHPDHSNNIIIKTANNRILSTDEKLSRFKLISQSYDILLNPAKRSLYDLKRNSTTTTQHHGYHSNEAYQYWNAGTWEDYHKYRNRPDPVEMNWSLFYWVLALLVVIEGSVILTRVENSLLVDSKHVETKSQVLDSYENFGLDNDKISRIKRFLWFRSFGLYNDKDKLDQEAKNNEVLLDDMHKRRQKLLNSLSTKNDKND
ncbi:hypothetical protein KAFR_0H00980 [Kazachstania africana CBS 2517]|uniref:J domain-containing protein n=1 Tax=Kazachstania africana (strain ATCC 22294 / BCRC 22015 / CBS 2517 / CECT 1963 / NBRC 1671 / NRRL Y-8276) TaxID=1071382 RepID=H2AYV2_KAZAF|nr:hypothetical protein KAFR_0H00980 [Kazachstania africana CBS 2517]CCF59508.1 hypothetical protein KAFR_0H00980 [Kazachstania africana CBS 2517]